MVDMSKSLASFHLSSGGQIPNHANSSQSEKFLRNKTAMDESVDHLFKEGESVAPQEGSSKGTYIFFYLPTHSSKFQSLCSKKCSSEKLQKGNRTFARPNLRED